ncbi:flagellar hook-basal body protein [Brevibacillus ruminantium]|uniref:Flagellar hook-basal body protein n=1 Tax=Brevibacillus ruminantium TaxID=2950604 RepID=A0ABY4WEA1_9BACL|nr:flagellar hook-basal body protein [Brevibacillus ruminantium]USG65388.1 flagellar hook-basal body protein [Brevibacillus ruminantium]
MIRGLYTATSGMLSLQRKQDSLTNNLANINTPGYKQDVGVMRSFPEQLLARIRDQEGPDIQGLPQMGGQAALIGRLHTGVYMSEALPVFRQGDIAETHDPYDVALLDNIQPDEEGNERRLFFGVARLNDPANDTAEPEQLRYTRNGNWSVNADGYLVTPDGYYVLNAQNQAIRVNDPDLPENNAGHTLEINQDGSMTYLRDGERVALGDQPLGIKMITNPQQLVREGTNIFRYEGDVEPVNVTEDPENVGFYGVKQGWLERSNVDPSQTMTDMLTVLRAYEANQRIITTLDGTLEKAANEIGRVNG